MKSIKIRVMTIEDYEAVYALWLMMPGLGINSVDDTRTGIAKYLERNPRTSFVAEKDGAIVGTILGGHDGRRGFLCHAAVNVSEQGQGIGTMLVNAAVAELKNEGIQKAALVAYASNTHGNGFWEKQGFYVRKDLFYRDKFI